MFYFSIYRSTVRILETRERGKGGEGGRGETKTSLTTRDNFCINILAHDQVRHVLQRVWKCSCTDTWTSPTKWFCPWIVVCVMCVHGSSCLLAREQRHRVGWQPSPLVSYPCFWDLITGILLSGLQGRTRENTCVLFNLEGPVTQYLLRMEKSFRNDIYGIHFGHNLDFFSPQGHGDPWTSSRTSKMTKVSKFFSTIIGRTSPPTSNIWQNKCSRIQQEKSLKRWQQLHCSKGCR